MFLAQRLYLLLSREGFYFLNCFPQFIQTNTVFPVSFPVYPANAPTLPDSKVPPAAFPHEKLFLSFPKGVISELPHLGHTNGFTRLFVKSC